MLLKSNFEFRGYQVVNSKDGTKQYCYFNLEDENGESGKFLYIGNLAYLNDLEKGNIYEFIIDFSTRYQSLKIIEIGREF